MKRTKHTCIIINVNNIPVTYDDRLMERIDIDRTITLGYLHDIGKYNGESHGHEISGYNYLKDKGYDEEYCNIQKINLL